MCNLRSLLKTGIGLTADSTAIMLLITLSKTREIDIITSLVLVFSSAAAIVLHSFLIREFAFASNSLQDTHYLTYLN